MATYRGITETHIKDMILELLQNGYPDRNASTRWDLLTSSGNFLPPKLVLKGAAARAGVIDATIKKGGGWPTNDILELLGCTIIPKGGLAAGQRPTSLLSDDELRNLAKVKGAKSPKLSTTTTTVRERHWAVAEYAKRMAKGYCDFRKLLGPFKVAGVPFLECHHILPLAEGGPDTIENTVALCPNCHRKMHLFSLEEDRTVLRRRVTNRAAAYSPQSAQADR